jgi:hypothetical protein
MSVVISRRLSRPAADSENILDEENLRFDREAGPSGAFGGWIISWFDVMITSKDCAPVTVSLGVQDGGAKQGEYTICPIAKILNLSNSTPW